MKVINFTSRHRGEGKSSIAKLVAEELVNQGKRVIILDNSYIDTFDDEDIKGALVAKSGLSRMFGVENGVGFEELMPFLKGELINQIDISEFMQVVGEKKNIPYVRNSDVNNVSEEDLIYITKILSENYDFVIIENIGVMKNAHNVLITRPLEYILKDEDFLKQFQSVLVNFYDHRMPLEFNQEKKLFFPYRPDLIMAENKYATSFDNKTMEVIRDLLSEVTGDKVVEVKKKKFSLFKRG